MESKEFQIVGASQGAGSTDKGEDKIESGSAMGSPDPKSHLVAGLSNAAAFLDSADTGNLKAAMETTGLENSGSAVGADFKATINSLGSSNDQDLDMGAMSLANNGPRKTKKKSGIKEGFITAEQQRRIDEILSDLESVYSGIKEGFKNAAERERQRPAVEQQRHFDDSSSDVVYFIGEMSRPSGKILSDLESIYSKIKEDFKTGVERERQRLAVERRRRIEKILSRLESVYHRTTEEESNADGTAEEESSADGTAEEESSADGTADEESDVDGMVNTYMDPKLYRAATTGAINVLAEAVRSDPEGMRIEQVTPRGDSVLHLAASFGHESIVNFILKSCPELVKHENQKGDLALHVAASAGHLTIIRSLAPFAQEFTLLSKMNKQGNTPMHVALENEQQETALFLVQLDPKVSYFLNKEGKSPFYMATKSGYLDIVDHITTEDPGRLDSCYHSKIANQEGKQRLYRPRGCQLLHASIVGRNKDVMDRIWSINSSLVYSTDEEGRTPLSLAASIGFLDGVCYILDKSVDSAYLRDRTGFFPIHWACTRGHIEIIDAFISRHPDSAELLNKQGENILHVAAKNGRAKLVSWMLKLSKLDMLINEKDKKGSTPLHWATLNCHPKVVSTLTWDKRVNLGIMNSEGQTALDIAEGEIHSYAPFRRRLTRTALQSANAPRSENANTRRQMTTADDSRKLPDPERVNTLVLVATLVATVTFACGFTLPGGINNSDPNLGMATMATKAAFQAFLICNTTALYSSILVAVILIWAQLGDLNLVINTVRIAIPLLGVALVSMSSAFVSGVYLAVSNHRWLAILVLIMGSISIAILSVVFFSLCFPLSSKSRIWRYLMYYPIELMMSVTSSDIEKAIAKELPAKPFEAYVREMSHVM